MALLNRFKQYLSNAIQDLENISHTEDLNLISFTSGIGNDVIRMVSSAPREIKELCSSIFLEMSWDLHSNQVILANAVNRDTILAGLNKLLTSLSNLHLSPSLTPSAEELENFSKACDRLWNLDTNRLQPTHDYEINIQDGKAVYDQSDRASQPLFSYVDEAVFERPTFRAFIALLDNYIADQAQAEVVTKEELAENTNFLSLVLESNCMKFVHNYLIAKHKAPAGVAEFKTMLNSAWFGLYRRKVENDTCGFEHVFVGEVQDDGHVSGMHNWIQLYQQERKGALNYLGYIRPKRVPNMHFASPDAHQQLVTVQFAWNGHVKPVSTSFIGTSPEFEIALYSLAYFMGQEKSVVRCGPYLVEMAAFPMRCHGKTFIGSSFPSEASQDSGVGSTDRGSGNTGTTHGAPHPQTHDTASGGHAQRHS